MGGLSALRRTCCVIRDLIHQSNFLVCLACAELQLTPTITPTIARPSMHRSFRLHARHICNSNHPSSVLLMQCDGIPVA